MAKLEYEYVDDFIGPRQNRSPDWDKPHANIKTYERVYNVIVDYDRFAGQIAAPRERVLHYNRCHRWADFFDDHTTAETICWNFSPNSTQQTWNHHVANLRNRCDERTLVFIYFNGKSKGKNELFQWKIPGIQGTVNAYDFMETMNDTAADIVWYLDCWAQTRWRPRWQREGRMTEIILAGPSEPDDNFGYTQVQEGDFVKGFVRCLRQHLHEGPLKRRPNATPMKSTPMIMASDDCLTNNATRVWVNRPCMRDRWDPTKTIYRIMCDPVLVWERQRYDFYGKQIQPPPDEDEPWEPENLGAIEPEEDEGIVADHLAGYTNDGDEDDQSDSSNSSGLFV